MLTDTASDLKNVLVNIFNTCCRSSHCQFMWTNEVN